MSSDGSTESSGLWHRIWKNLAIGVTGSGLLLVLNLARTTLLARTLPVDDFGRLFIVIGFFGVAWLLIDVKTGDLVYKFLPEFETDDDPVGARTLLVSSFVLSSSLGVVVLVAAWVSSGLIAGGLYGDSGLAPIFRIYAAAMPFVALEGLIAAILRIQDRFQSLAMAQVGGASFTVAVLAYLWVTGDPVSLALAAGLVVGGKVIQILLSSAVVAKSLRDHVGGGHDGDPWVALSSLNRYRSELTSTLWQTNIAGYLKVGSERGGYAILGAVASPTEVAFYGLAVQLAIPLRELQTNLQASAAPEILRLWARGAHATLRRVVHRVTAYAGVAGLVAMPVAWVLAPWGVSLVAGDEYLGAVTPFRVVIATGLLTLTSLAYYPLALAMQRLARRNAVVALRFVFLGVALPFGLTAFRLAVVQFCGAAATRMLNDYQLFRELERSGGLEPQGLMPALMRAVRPEGPEGD